MFARNPMISDMVARLFEAAGPLKRGDVLTRETIEGILGVPPNVGHWQYCIRRFEARMEAERGIGIWAEYGHGHRLLTESEQLEVWSRRERKARRQYRKGRRTVAALPVADLSFHQMRARAFLLDESERVIREAEARERRNRVLFRPTPVEPAPRFDMLPAAAPA